MSGETDLALLLQNLQPRLDPRPFVFCSVDPEKSRQLLVYSIGMFRETEGVTIILERSWAQAVDLPDTEECWAMITLNIHSDLTAIGFLAALTNTLASEGLSVNVISAFYHDHLFVLWDEKERAMAKLKEFDRPATNAT
jgi:hypothetical protein